MSSDVWIGGATFIMAVLGGIVAVRPPDKAWQKWTYVALFTIIGLIGLSFVKRQSNEAATASLQLSQGISNLGRSTTEIQRIEGLNTQLQQQLLVSNATISSLAKQNLIETTGGDEYCWLVPVDPLPVGLGGDPAHQGNNWRQLALKNSGKVVLPTCDLRFMPFPTEEELKSGVAPSPPFLLYHFDKVPVMGRRYYRYTPYFIKGDRTYSGVIQTPTHTFNEVIAFKPDPAGRPLFIPQCTVATPASGKMLENDCNPQ